MPAPITAAGVVLTRERSNVRQTLILHRPHRRDWSLPKGKLDPGEHLLDCAVRECDEETGIMPVLGVPLGKQNYQLVGGAKTVHYWHGTVGHENGFTPDDEVDEIRWVGLKEARALLTYRRDVEFVERAMSLPATQPLVILRHAAAVSRSDFAGDDEARPLAGKGRSQSRALVTLLQAYGVTQAYSSDSVRCVETVTPFAQATRTAIQPEPEFSEPGFAKSPQASLTRFQELLVDPRPAVLCTHRPVLPSLFEALLPLASGPTKQLLRAVLDNGLAPGSFLVVHRAFGKNKVKVLAAEHAKPKKAEHDARHSLRS